MPDRLTPEQIAVEMWRSQPRGYLSELRSRGYVVVHLDEVRAALIDWYDESRTGSRAKTADEAFRVIFGDV